MDTESIIFMGSFIVAAVLYLAYKVYKRTKRRWGENG